MLTVSITLREAFDDESQRFVPLETYDLELEHSLVSLSKWESHFEKPFLGREEKTTEETLFYIQQCMPTGKIPPGEFLEKLSKENYEQIQKYINAKHSATWFREEKTVGTRQIITSGVIYGWMVALRIPFEPAQNWHLNELFTLIRVCNEQQKPPKKMGRAEAARQQAQLNAQRQAQMRTRG